MYVNLSAHQDGSGNYTGIVGGAMIRQTTDADRQLFGMTDNSVKDAINKFFGRRPNDVFYNDPTRWGNKYQEYGWQPVTLILQPVSAVFTGIKVADASLASHEVTNETHKTVNVDVAFTTQKDNTAETNWSRTSTLSVSQSVSFGIRFFGADTSVSFSQAWQQGGSQSQTISIGSSVSIFYELDPGETIVVTNWGDIGTATVKITYRANLSGLVFANYSSRYRDHHFWGLPINSVLNTLGRPNWITIEQDLHLKSYLYSKTIVKSKSKPDKEEKIDINYRLVFPADPSPDSLEGVKVSNEMAV